MNRKRLYTTCVCFFLYTLANCQTLSLSDCIGLALQNNKQIKIASIQQDIAKDAQKVARTKRLPKVNAIAGYEVMSREISLLNNQQKTALTTAGQSLATNITGTLENILGKFVSDGIISTEMANELVNRFGNSMTPISDYGNTLGRNVVDAFRTDTRQIWAGSVMLQQPIYMGGAITAINKMADIGIDISNQTFNLKQEQAIYDIESTYWLVVSLKHKQSLALKYQELVTKLQEDVNKMIDEGVATRADGLKVNVKLGEAEMLSIEASNGVELAKMLLCQLCGLPMNSKITLVDEVEDNIITKEKNIKNVFDDTIQSDEIENNDLNNRPELNILESAITLSKYAEKLVSSSYRPQFALTGGYLISNPNTFNGFERKFMGVWNVGLLLKIPLWSWKEGRYKSNMAKKTTELVSIEYFDISEKINLQVSQCKFKCSESYKKYEIATQNLGSAEENLRCADVGFQEGVMDVTDVMTAQTAWQQAKTNYIESIIGIKIANLNLRKAEGRLLTN